MILVAEQTQWAGDFPNHVYLLSDDKSKMYGYAQFNTSDIKMMKKPIGFDTRGRKFITLHQIPDEPKGKKVVGSKGDVYYVNDGQCSCPGFKFRGECKHV